MLRLLQFFLFPFSEPPPPVLLVEHLFTRPFSAFWPESRSPQPQTRLCYPRVSRIFLRFYRSSFGGFSFSKHHFVATRSAPCFLDFPDLVLLTCSLSVLRIPSFFLHSLTQSSSLACPTATGLSFFVFSSFFSYLFFPC